MIKQIKQQSTSTSPQTEGDLNYSSVEEHSVSSLTDADREFLFNQLLEGIAHGWHSVKVAKFFQRLEEKGEQKLWIAWLERYQAKILAGSDLYQQQLGARMIRLGEISQSISSIKQIGSTAYHIGKQIIYGKNPDLIWEYDGADLPLVTEEAIEERSVEHKAIEPKNETSTVASNTSNSSSFTEAANWIQDAIAEFVELAEQASEGSVITESENENNSEEQLNSEAVESSQPAEQQNQVLSSPEAVELSQPAEQQNQQTLSSPETVELSQPAEQQNQRLSSSETVELSKPAEQQNQVLSSSETVELSQPSEQASQELSVAHSVGRQEEENLAKVPNLVKTTESSSFLLAEENVINLSWQQFTELIEKDDYLVEQIATQFNLTDKDPQSIIKAVTSQLNEGESTSIDESTLKLVESWFDLGLKQASAGDLDQAVISWEKALELNPNLGEAWHNRGSALGRLGNYEEALASFDQTLKISPHKAQAWNERGHALYQLRQWQGAVDSWDRAIAIISNNYQFWYNRGCALEELQKYQEAIASHEKALEIKPDFQLARARYISLLANRRPIN